jgi:Predicted membrane protein
MLAFYILANILLTALIIYVISNVFPGIKVQSFGTAVIVAVILGVLNALIRPIALLLTLPINILTLGLFTFVVMGAMVWLTTQIVPGFTVTNFWWCILFAIILAVFNGLIFSIMP